MKAKVIQDRCIGCGNCVALTENQVFDFNEEGVAECIVDEVPNELEEITNDAIAQCPVDAIEEVTEEEEK